MLFGSTARGDDTPESDVDLLIWARPGADRLAIARRLSRGVRRDVQVLDITDAESRPSLLSSALRDGRPLVDRASRWSELVGRRATISRAAVRERSEISDQAAAARKFFAAAAEAA